MEESNIKTFVPKEVKSNDAKSTLNSLSPREIVLSLIHI